jgi:hypothetical protein
MSSFFSRNDREEQSNIRSDESLALRVSELTATLQEHDQLVSDACAVLRNAGNSLTSVRAKYEPVKEHASTLSSTSTHAAQVSSDLLNLVVSLKVHHKVSISRYPHALAPVIVGLHLKAICLGFTLTAFRLLGDLAHSSCHTSHTLARATGDAYFV